MFRRARRRRAEVSPASLHLFQSSECEFLPRRNTAQILRTFPVLSLTFRTPFVIPMRILACLTPQDDVSATLLQRLSWCQELALVLCSSKLNLSGANGNVIM